MFGDHFLYSTLHVEPQEKTFLSVRMFPNKMLAATILSSYTWGSFTNLISYPLIEKFLYSYMYI